MSEVPVAPTLQIYIIRHGETAWSLSGRHTGRTELSLTPHGEATARHLAVLLRGVSFSQVLSSPRLRARATCELAGLGRAAKADPLLAEWDYGDFEGLTTDEIQQQQPGWDIWQDGCPGGESPTDTGARADTLIARLSPARGAAALFTHGQFARLLAARWIGLAPGRGQQFASDTASIGILGFEPRHPLRRVIAMWNARAAALGLDPGGDLPARR